MPQDALVMLAVLFLLVGALYASVGHAGASGYLAVMALAGMEAGVMRPVALAVNVLVAGIAFAQFARAGHFSWRVFWPLAAGSAPAAFVGGMVELPAAPLKAAMGVVLLLSAARMAWTGLARREAAAPRMPGPAASAAWGAGIGVVAGLTGTGGGIFLSPLMLILNWAGTKQVAATAALFILVNSAAGLGGVVSRGWAPGAWVAVLACAAGVGGWAGAAYGSRRATPAALRLLLAGVLVIAGAKLLVR